MMSAVAAWTSPVLVVAVVAAVTTGGVEAPLFVLAVLTAPLLALLAGPVRRDERSGFAFTIALVSVACVLGAGFRAVTDLGHLLGLETGATLGPAIVLVAVTSLWPGHRRVAGAALGLGAAALLAALVMLGVAVGHDPWTAWSRVASRDAFALGPRSEWTRGGARFFAPVTLTFVEPHRVTTATAGVFRVTERDRAVIVRERRLAAGDGLTLRPGDRLSVPAGARVRFEPGKRVPGAPASGVTWADGADPPRARLLAWWLGVTVTLAGGALGIVRPTAPSSRADALLGPAAALVVALAAACWGVYAVEAAPELSIGAPAAASLARLAPVVADEPWRSRLLVAIVLALVALLLASAAALRQRLVELAAGEAGRGGVGGAIWIGVVGAAAAGSVAVADGWSLLLQGAGLAAATLLGPLLATGDTAGLERARAAGAVTGGVLFVVLVAAAHWLAPPGGPAAVVARYPALVAVPGAWLVAVLSRRAASAHGEAVAAARRR